MQIYESLSKEDKEELIIERIKREGVPMCEMDILNIISLVVLEKLLFSENGKQLLSNNEFLTCKKCFNCMIEKEILKQKVNSTKYELTTQEVKKISVF